MSPRNLVQLTFSTLERASVEPARVARQVVLVLPDVVPSMVLPFTRPVYWTPPALKLI